MQLLRLAYSTLFLIALIAFFVSWSQVGGQTHVDLLPWWVKVGLGGSVAFTVVRAAASAVAGERAWNGQTLKWLGLTLALLIVSGLATYYAHTYLEETDQGDAEAEPAISGLLGTQGGTLIWSRCPNNCAMPVSVADRSPRC
jgi:hypothetical protein